MLLNCLQKRYDEFMRLIRLWKHLHLLKRGGIGMMPGGVADALVGSCAVDCPACPHELPPILIDGEQGLDRDDETVNSRSADGGGEMGGGR